MTKLAGEIRVAMDSGGISAGAAAVFAELQCLCQPHSEITVTAVGTPGMCYADAQAEFRIAGRPLLHFGRLNAVSARFVFEEFVVNGRAPAQNTAHDYLVLGSREVSNRMPDSVHSIVCADTTQRGDLDLLALLKAAVPPQIEIIEAADFGFYNRKFALQFFPGGYMIADLARDSIAKAVHRVLDRKAPEVGTVLEEGAQLRIASRHCGVIDPEKVEAYEATGGYSALRRAVGLSPNAIVEEVLKSGLRGRGGAGYSTGKKWQLTAAESSVQKYVICNADEGDPGAFMDRSLLESDPHTVLEGLILAGYAIGASIGYFYVRVEYPLATMRLQKAIDAARSKGYLGEKILGSGFSFDVAVRLGAGAYVCGEETALIASIEGKRGSPHARPPYPSVKGLHDAPTCINNVETLASIPEIILRGASWYAAIGDHKSPGTKLFAVSGKIRRTQLVEVPLGVSVDHVVNNICGGVHAGKKTKAVQTGGPSGGLVPANLLETQLTYEHMAALGSIIGSGGMIVLDEQVNMVELVRFYLGFNIDESCGKCAPCRIGGFQLTKLFDKLLAHEATRADFDQVVRIANAMKSASLCGLGKSAPSPLLSTLHFFPEEYEACLKK